MSTIKQCPRCGAELDGPSPAGICPRCLLRSCIESLADDPSLTTNPATALHPSLRRFGDYELIEEIARGGMGIVYKAWQLSLNRIVAVKMILSGQFASKQEVLRFRSEAEAAANLRHPNIVAIYETGEHEGNHYFSMECVAGCSLTELVRKHGPLPARQAARYLRTVATAIHYAHQENILHRDLKPSNILIDANDEPRVTDFGLAKRVHGDFGLTVTGQVLGSPSFMPPEQAGAVDGKVGPWSDVYGLGAILYHLLTGRPPFQGQSIDSVLAQLRDREPVSPRLLAPGVPRDLETICLKCLEKQPGKRYQSAQDVAGELSRFLADEPIHARPVGRPEKVWRWCRGKPALAAAFGLALLLLLVIAVGSPIALIQISRAQRESQQNLYVANVRLASEAIDANDLFKARDYLQRTESSAIQRAMRGWEWRYLEGRCRGDQLATLGRHESWISTLATSPDGRWLASMSEDGVVKLWDWSARKEIASWLAHSNQVRTMPHLRPHALEFLPDGATLVTAGQDRTIRFWSVETRRPTAVIDGFNHSVVRLAVSRDGTLLAAGTSRGEVSLWNLRTHPPALLTRRQTSVSVLFGGLALAPDGSTLLVGGAERPVLRFDISDPDAIEESAALPDSAIPLKVSTDGRWLATVGLDRQRIRLWEFPELTPARTMRAQGGIVGALAFSPDGQTLASGQHSGQIRLWNLAGQGDPVTLVGHEDMLTGLAFSRDGRTLASTSYDKTVRLWDATRAEHGGTMIRHGARVRAVAFSPDSRRLASMANEPAVDGALHYSLKLWQVEDLALLAAVTNSSAPYGGHVVFSPDGSEIAVDDHDRLRFYRAPSLELNGATRERCAGFAPDGRSVFFVADKRILRRESFDRPATEFVTESGRVDSLAVSPDGRTLAIGLSGGDIHLADAENGKQLATLTGHQSVVVQVTFSPDGRTLVSAGQDDKLGIWDVASRRPLALLHAQSGLNRVVFSPDGRTLASCGNDGVVRLWNLLRWQESAVLPGHSTAINDVAFSPDGQWLAGAFDDGTIQLWRAPSHQ